MLIYYSEMLRNTYFVPNINTFELWLSRNYFTGVCQIAITICWGTA